MQNAQRFSGLEKTLEGFGTIYRKIKTENAGELAKIRFEFVSTGDWMLCHGKRIDDLEL